MRQPEANGKTHQHVLAARRHLDYEYNSKTFGDRPLGVHGIELPKFADSNKKYWEVSQGPVGEQSYRKLLQTRKLT